MEKKSKIWTIVEAASFISLLDEYDMIASTSEVAGLEDHLIYTIKLKLNDSESNREGDNTSD